MKLGITAIVKNEALYLKEWILHHFMQGVTEFFLYDNDSTDGLEQVLASYPINEIKVTVIPWSGKCMHLAAYDDSLKKHRRLVDWMVFLDVDEFLYSTKHEKVIKHLEIITASDGYNLGVVRVPWLLFGSGGQVEYAPEPVIARFTKRAATTNIHSKSIVKMQKVVCAGADTHTFRTKGRTLTNPPDIFINHYHVKSYDEYLIRCARGRGDIDFFRNPDIDFPAHDINEVEDTYLKDKYADRLKELL